MIWGNETDIGKVEQKQTRGTAVTKVIYICGHKGDPRAQGPTSLIPNRRAESRRGKAERQRRMTG